MSSPSVVRLAVDWRVVMILLTSRIVALLCWGLTNPVLRICFSQQRLDSQAMLHGATRTPVMPGYFFYTEAHQGAEVAFGEPTRVCASASEACFAAGSRALEMGIFAGAKSLLSNQLTGWL